MTKKPKFDTLHPTTHGHFYASSVAEWKTSQNPETLIAAMRAGGLAFQLWWVPVPIDAPYRIKFYKPDVPDAVALASWGYDQYL